MRSLFFYLKFILGKKQTTFKGGALLKRLTTEDFVFRAKGLYGEKYDYSKVEYVNNHTDVCIICPKHGEFWQTPTSHLISKAGCPICNESKLEEEIYESGTEEFNLHWKANAYTHIFTRDDGNLYTNNPGRDLNCGALSCFGDYIVEVALKDLDDLRSNKKGLDFSKIK